MLRETNYVKPYPSKLVIEDLITRDGPADANSYSPFDGKKSVVDAQFSGSQRHRFRIKDFILHNKNRDLDPSRVKISKNHGMLQEQDKVVAGFTRLEDMFENGMESSSVEEYIVMLCVGFKTDNTSPYKVNADIPTRYISNIDGDDDIVEEKYLINRIDEDSISNADYESIIKELPYLIKSIWSYSKMYQANLFSFMFAYMDIIEKKHRGVSISDFMDYKTYLIKRDGTFERQFYHSDDNKYVIYPRVTKIFIYPGSHQVEFNLCMKYMKYLKLLGIDYHDEDPLEYNNEFINSILCTYLPTNDEYFTKYKDVDAEIISALKPENILSMTKVHMYTSNYSKNKTFDYTQSAYFISERIKLAYKLNEYGSEMFSNKEDITISLLEDILYLMNKERGQDLMVSVPRHLVSFEWNGLLYFNKALCDVDGKYFGRFKGSDDYKVILTKYGFIVALEESYNDVYFLTPDDAKTALKEYIENGEIQSEANWKSL